MEHWEGLRAPKKQLHSTLVGRKVVQRHVKELLTHYNITALGGVLVLALLTGPCAGISPRLSCQLPQRTFHDVRRDLFHSGSAACPIAGAKTAQSIPFGALRKNSEKWAIGGDLSVWPFLGFPVPGLRPGADDLRWMTTVQLSF